MNEIQTKFPSCVPATAPLPLRATLYNGLISDGIPVASRSLSSRSAHAVCYSMKSKSICRWNSDKSLRWKHLHSPPLPPCTPWQWGPRVRPTLCCLPARCHPGRGNPCHIFLLKRLKYYNLRNGIMWQRPFSREKTVAKLSFFTFSSAKVVALQGISVARIIFLSFYIKNLVK